MAKSSKTKVKEPSAPATETAPNTASNTNADAVGFSKADFLRVAESIENGSVNKGLVTELRSVAGKLKAVNVGGGFNSADYTRIADLIENGNTTPETVAELKAAAKGLKG